MLVVLVIRFPSIRTSPLLSKISRCSQSRYRASTKPTRSDPSEGAFRIFTAYVVVTALTAAANTFAATVDFTRPDWLLRNMAKARVPQSWLFSLGALKAAGALGLLIGIGVPLLGVAASVGLVLFFIGALITHFRARYWAIAPPVAFLLLAVGSLVLRLASS